MGDALEFIITHPVSDVFILTLAFWIFYMRREARDADRTIVRISQVLIAFVLVLMNMILFLVYTVRIPPDIIRFLVSLTIGVQTVAAIATAISLRRPW
jgi:hypothetical protein